MFVLDNATPRNSEDTGRLKLVIVLSFFMTSWVYIVYCGIGCSDNNVTPGRLY